MQLLFTAADNAGLDAKIMAVSSYDPHRLPSVAISGPTYVAFVTIFNVVVDNSCTGTISSRPSGGPRARSGTLRTLACPTSGSSRGLTSHGPIKTIKHSEGQFSGLWHNNLKCIQKICPQSFIGSFNISKIASLMGLGASTLPNESPVFTAVRHGNVSALHHALATAGADANEKTHGRLEPLPSPTPVSWLASWFQPQHTVRALICNVKLLTLTFVSN
jgi:hypothetical protein